MREEAQLYQIEIDEIEQALTETPRIQQQFGKLQRQLAKLEDQYQAITVGKSEAEMNQMLEANRQSDSFALLEKALPPDWPIAPARKRILMMGGLLSTLAALSLVFVIEMRSPVIRTQGQLERQLRLRAVASIPVLHSRRARRLRRLRDLVKVTGFLAITATAAAMILKLTR